MILREVQESDFYFLRKMLYEAVFWRDSEDKPSFEEGLLYPGVQNALVDWGKREGDIAVIAVENSLAMGVAWYRFCTDSNAIRGYLNVDTPVLVVAVHSDYRHRGIGKKMINWLIDYACNHNIQNISLSVSKDNYAINLYRQLGFKAYVDNGDSFIMVRKIEK